MDIAKRLVLELEKAAERLRNDAGSVAVEEAGLAFAESGGTADVMDGVQSALEREIAFATRSLLRERAQRLAGALERVREGSYGICEQCGDRIASARLRALPEVTTCLGCQQRRESRDAHGHLEPMSLVDD
jgi:RNA polymerase-binding transcription factor DksA